MMQLFFMQRLFQDNYGVPIITAPIHITAMRVKNSNELTIGEWTPAKGFENTSFKIQNKKRVLKVGKVIITISLELL